jgi:hypothetical protein
MCFTIVFYLLNTFVSQKADQASVIFLTLDSVFRRNSLTFTVETKLLLLGTSVQQLSRLSLYI